MHSVIEEWQEYAGKQEEKIERIVTNHESTVKDQKHEIKVLKRSKDSNNAPEASRC